MLFRGTMKKIIGIVQTKNSDNAGRVAFTLADANGRLIPCRSGAGYKSVKPRRGDKDAIPSEKLRELIPDGETRGFIYISLEILPKSPMARSRDKSSRSLSFE